MWKWTLYILFIIFCSLLQNSSGVSRIDPLVDTKIGLIRGLSANDGDYSMFMGIPYATVDENNPFGPSKPHPGFNDAFDAYDDSAICPQTEEFNNTIVGTLDCLHVNVYVPNSANTRNRLPVMVWIYGGGFTIGFSGRYLYGPKYLVKQNVILVTLNYRLGPYGFMCLETPDVPGNQGLKDQQLGLKWIKNNIEAFGGDPNQITIFGESAGGASVGFHLTYSQEKLFNQVIMQSGTTLNPWTIIEQDSTSAIKLASILGLRTSDTNIALEFLASIDPKLVIAAATELDHMWRPCVEQEFENVERFIHDYPINIQEPSLGNMPALLGYNSDEGLYIIDTDFDSFNVFEFYLKSFFNFTDDYLNEMVEVVRHFYIGDENNSSDLKEEITNFYADLIFNYPAVRTLQQYLDNGFNDIYYYVFSYDSERNFVKDRLNLTSAGATHADEISFLFDISYMKEPTPENQLVIDRMTTLWANFVKFGNPTPQTSELIPVQWPAVTKNALYYLNIDANLTVGKRNYHARMAFWKLFYTINEEYQLGYKSQY